MVSVGLFTISATEMECWSDQYGKFTKMRPDFVETDTGHLLVRKTSNLVEICGGDEGSDKRKREGKVNPHKTDSPLVPGPDDPFR
jgi:hypothetical protein